MLFKFHVLSFVKRSRFQELAVCTEQARVCHKEEDEVEMGWACFVLLFAPPSFLFAPPGPISLYFVIFAFLFHFWFYYFIPKYKKCLKIFSHFFYIYLAFYSFLSNIKNTFNTFYYLFKSKNNVNNTFIFISYFYSHWKYFLEYTLFL